MERDFSPGTIVCNTHNDMPIYGIVLPKKSFLELFQKEKGPWPANKIIEKDKKFYEKYGYYIPFEVNGIQDPHSYSSIDSRKILPSEYFLNDKKRIGAKYFGGIYSPNLERVLNFEVIGDLHNKISYDLKQLKLINQIRDLSFEENGGISHNIRRVSFEMEVIIQYFSEEFKGKSLKHIKHNKGLVTMELVKMLRFCGFKEINIFDLDNLINS